MGAIWIRHAKEIEVATREATDVIRAKL